MKPNLRPQQSVRLSDWLGVSGAAPDVFASVRSTLAVFEPCAAWLSIGDNMNTVFKARTADGHVYQVFEDGSCDGFPPGTMIINGWMRMLNYERGLRIQSAQKCVVADEKPADFIP